DAQPVGPRIDGALPARRPRDDRDRGDPRARRRERGVERGLPGAADVDAEGRRRVPREPRALQAPDLGVARSESRGPASGGGRLLAVLAWPPWSGRSARCSVRAVLRAEAAAFSSPVIPSPRVLRGSRRAFRLTRGGENRW